MDTTRYKDDLIDVFNRNAGSYDRSGVEFFTPIARRLVELADVRAGEQVLDVGCGRGACLFPAASAAGSSGHVTGIDLSTAMIAHTGEEVARKRLTNITLRLMDAETPDLPPTSFDAILGSFSIVLLPDPPAALRHYPGLLREGGRLAFSGPDFRRRTGSPRPESLTRVLDAADKLFAPGAALWATDGASTWLGDLDRLTATLTAAGFSAVDIHDEPHLMRIRSGEDWIRWSWTNGLRLVWEQTPRHERTRLQTDIITELNGLRDSEGTITVENPVRYVIARP